ncbi:DUF4232 domain-containing protein [Streptomyces xanthii]|uniref:DUF4232 domain-containing protein n=1 Tax=Streptomyces xanthii TaxID=2768069 RepID=A0A7H1BAD1_9ACTN|nr:DUF4232 domain-containing protein [Streptomyces xanthii]QNS05686.1 DUF4232 domain-containing protein [Streptomyces xanthii]
MFRSSSPSSRLPARLPARVTAVTLTAVLAGLGAAGTASSSPKAAAPASGSLRTCALGDLYLSMGRKEGAAGSLYWTIRFTNTSTTSCTLRGYPGVSALDTAHRQIGPAAHRTGEHASTVRLAPAHSASAVIRTTNGPLGGPCLRTGSYLRVYPPGSYHADLVPARWTICSHLFDVSPIKT